jgi:hypothetical protein
MGPPGEISMCGRTNCARTDVSPLACTTKTAANISAGWKSPSPCGKPAPHSVIRRGGLVSGPLPPAVLQQPGFCEAQIARGAEDEMVVHGDVQETPGVDQLARDGPGPGANVDWRYRNACID